MSARSPTPRDPGFTLVEMVVSLTIVAILLSLAFPAMKAFKDPGEARHVSALLDLSRALRARAVSERRPYQIVFAAQSIYGLRYFYPYNEESTFAEFLREQDEERVKRKEEIKRIEVQRLQMALDEPETPDGRPPPLPNIDDEYFLREIALPEGLRVEVRPWGALPWEAVEGAKIQRWVFQPSGLCDPLQVRLGAEGKWQELTFEVLTGDLGTQRIYAQ